MKVEKTRSEPSLFNFKTKISRSPLWVSSKAPAVVGKSVDCVVALMIIFPVGSI